MTRINVVPVEELCDQHLFAEWRELTRIPNSILSGRLYVRDIPSKYTVRTKDNPTGGKGHVKFFSNKLLFLSNRYKDILKELEEREMPQNNYWPKKEFKSSLWQDYTPTKEAQTLNRLRINEKMPKSPRYAKQYLV